MIYIRSALAISFFPRASFLLFLLYHFYLYSYPSGFHLLALLVLFLSLNWLMMVTMLKLELPAYMRGDVSIDQPRAIFNTVPWPAWSIALGPDFTLFMPVSHRTASVYNAAPPPPLGQPPLEPPRSPPRHRNESSYERLETEESEDAESIESYQRQRPVRDSLVVSTRDLELGEMNDNRSRMDNINERSVI